MADWSPTGESFSISDRASSSAQLERAYRRLIEFYPRSFRHENTEEIIAVLLATAREDQRRPSIAEASDLLRGALRMRLGLSNCPRTVLYAVRLMYLGALAEVAVLVTILVSVGRIESGARAMAVRAIGPHAAPALSQQVLARVASTVGAELAADVVITLFAIAGWLFLAWANGKGFPAARVAAIILCAFYVAVMPLSLVNGHAVLAPVPVIAAGVAGVIGVVTVILLVMKQSWPYYERQAVTS
jgi:hypothetical protein